MRQVGPTSNLVDRISDIKEEFTNNCPKDIHQEAEANEMHNLLLEWCTATIFDASRESSSPESITELKQAAGRAKEQAEKKKDKEKQLEQGDIQKKWRAWVEQATQGGAKTLHIWGILPRKEYYEKLSHQKGTHQQCHGTSCKTKSPN